MLQGEHFRTRDNDADIDVFSESYDSHSCSQVSLQLFAEHEGELILWHAMPKVHMPAFLSLFTGHPLM